MIYPCGSAGWGWTALKVTNFKPSTEVRTELIPSPVKLQKNIYILKYMKQNTNLKSCFKNRIMQCFVIFNLDNLVLKLYIYIYMYICMYIIMYTSETIKI